MTLTKLKHSLNTIILSIGAALCLASFIPTLNFTFILIFSLGLYVLSISRVKNGSLHTGLFVSLWLATLAVGFFAATYRPNGFHYPLIWQTDELFVGGDAFALYVNIAKTLGGYLVILWLFVGADKDSSRTMPLKTSCAVAAALTLGILLVAWSLGVGWLPKISSGLPYFIAINLFITVIAEEAFFRLLIQQKITKLFAQRILGNGIALCLTTVIFAFAHTPHIDVGFLLYFIAGLSYGLVFIITQRFSMAVAVHFGVNLLHFIFLEYPLSI